MANLYITYVNAEDAEGKPQNTTYDTNGAEITDDALWNAKKQIAQYIPNCSPYEITITFFAKLEG